jgi:DNA-binding transcriptional ArsR family regulator
VPRLNRRAGAVLTALGDPTRRHVVELLGSSADGATATELALALPVSRQAVTKHLSALADVGLVAPERSGREVRWSLHPEPLADAVDWMVQVGGKWDRRLAALERHVRP